MPVPLLLALAPELIKAGLGVAQMIKGQELGKTDRPVKSVNSAATQALNINKFLAGSRNAPGVVETEQNLGENYANTLQVAKEIGNPDVGQLYRNETRALSQLGVEDSKFRTNALFNLASQLNSYGNLQDDVFEYNKVDPYNNAMEASNNLKNAGATNAFGAASGMSSLFQNLITAKLVMEGIAGTDDSLKTDGTADKSKTDKSIIPSHKPSDVNMEGTDQSGFFKNMLNIISNIKTIGQVNY